MTPGACIVMVDSIGQRQHGEVVAVYPRTIDVHCPDGYRRALRRDGAWSPKVSAEVVWTRGCA